MSRIKLFFGRLNNKKVPLVSLVFVAIVGMIAGVIAATIVVNQTANYAGEGGTYQTSSGVITFTDSGLLIVNVAVTPLNTTMTFPTSGNTNFYSGQTFTVGHWVEVLVFSDGASDPASHTVKVTIKTSSSAPSGTVLTGFNPLQFTLTGANVASPGTITAYLDLGVTSITSPMTILVTAT